MVNEKLETVAHRWLDERGVTPEDIAELVYFLQEPYHDELTVHECEHHVRRVIQKREVQNAILTGIALDRLAEDHKLEEPLLTSVLHDDSLYGVDEIIALSIVNIYGSIGFTNYGYIDKEKPGILKYLNDKEHKLCHTFLDDIVGAIAAAASSRLAHSSRGEE
ncbi:phosphatidylglycerophosphatase A [Bacillaceae bacterium SIJ1]|uniref:phosphatidylglycerophosphatase A family protein n=1 Tax=Litoribacterium kuwaitense TaxID=1398745 RepID=UPI0013EA1E28|nr:phosphatidylglycerophosphatase A [Litoribacterium kuwaitense]NGP46167.1 phosphatidylglycerophosphatase A [Litoribacterium kuwaitense]